MIELISLTNTPARLGARWEPVSELLGSRVATTNECNVYEMDHRKTDIISEYIISANRDRCDDTLL